MASSGADSISVDAGTVTGGTAAGMSRWWLYARSVTAAMQQIILPGLFEKAADHDYAILSEALG